MNRKRSGPSRPLMLAALLSGTAMALPAARAADFPDRPLRAVVPFAPGGVNDITARLLAPYLSKLLGQAVVIENKPGAAGNIGVDYMVKSPPDGHTILFSGAASTQNPALYRKLPFDPIADVQPVAPVTQSPYIIAITAANPVRTIKELIAYGRKNPGRLNGAAGGIGTRLSVELFAMHAGIKVEVIPYKGTGPASAAVAAGEADIAITDTSGFVPFINAGKVRILAVAGDKRIPAYPDAPTIVEAGLPGYRSGALIGVYAPAKTPAGNVQALNSAINKVVLMPEVTQQLRKLGGEPEPMSVADFTSWYRREVQLWKDVVAKANIPAAD